MGFNYIEYVKRGSNPLLKEEQSPIKPPTSESGLKIWIRKKYKISEDDVATLFQTNPNAIENGKFRTVEAIEAALERADIEFKSLLNTSPADNTATDNDTQDSKATKAQIEDIRNKWTEMNDQLTAVYGKVIDQLEENFNIDIKIDEQQGFLRLNARKLLDTPEYDQYESYKVKIEAMSVYFDGKVDFENLNQDHGKVIVEKLDEDFREFLRERGYGSLQDPGAENRPDDFEEPKQPEEPVESDQMLEAKKLEIVKELTDSSSPFNVSQKIDSLSSYLAEKTKAIIAQQKKSITSFLEERDMKKAYEDHIEQMDQILSKSSGEGNIETDIYNRLLFLKYIETAPQATVESFLDNSDNFEVFYMQLRRSVFKSDAVGIAKGLSENLEEPQEGQVLDIMFDNLENISNQTQGWDTSNSIITSIFEEFKKQTGLNLENYLPSNINLNIPPTAYEGRVEELENMMSDDTLKLIKEKTSSDFEYKEVLAQYSRLRVIAENVKDYVPSEGEKPSLVNLLPDPDKDSDGVSELINEIVEFVNTPYMNYNDYALFWITTRTGGPGAGIGIHNMPIQTTLEDQQYEKVNMVLNEYVKTFPPEVSKTLTKVINDSEVQFYIRNYIKFNRLDKLSLRSGMEDFTTIGNMEPSALFENDVQMIFEGLFPAINKFVGEKLGTDAPFITTMNNDILISRKGISILSQESRRNLEKICEAILDRTAIYERNIKLKEDIIKSYKKAIDSIEEIEDRQIQDAANKVITALKQGDIDAATQAQFSLTAKIAEQNSVTLIQKLTLWNKTTKETELKDLLQSTVNDLNELGVDDIDFNMFDKLKQSTSQDLEDLNKVVQKGMGDGETDLETEPDDIPDIDPLQELFKGSISSLLLEQEDNMSANFIQGINYLSLIDLHFNTILQAVNNLILIFNNVESLHLSKDSVHKYVTQDYKNLLQLVNSNRVPSFEATGLYTVIENGLSFITTIENIDNRIKNNLSK